MSLKGTFEKVKIAKSRGSEEGGRRYSAAVMDHGVLA